MSISVVYSYPHHSCIFIQSDFISPFRTCSVNMSVFPLFFFFPASNAVYAQLEWALTVWLPGKPTQLRSYWPNFSLGDHKNDKRNNWLGEKNEDSAHASIAEWLSFSGYCGKLLQMSKSRGYFPGKGLPQLNAVVTFFFAKCISLEAGRSADSPQPIHPKSCNIALQLGLWMGNFCKQFLITQDIKKTLESSACTWKNLHGNKNT